MKKIITFISALIMATVALFSFTACAPAKSKVVDVTPNKIVVGYTDYKPMNYEEKGVLKGFDTELALMTFTALGYDVQFTLIDWANKYMELESGNIDCVWNGFTMNSSDKIDGVDTPREDIVDFTKPYMYNAQCIIRASATEITSIADLANKSVAYEAGSAGASYVSSKIKDNVNFIDTPLTSQMDAVTQVLAGTCDYAVIDINLARSIAGKGNYSNIVINESYSALNLPEEFYAVAFAQGSELDEKVDIIFDAFAKTGQLKALADKYGLGEVVILDY